MASRFDQAIGKTRRAFLKQAYGQFPTPHRAGRGEETSYTPQTSAWGLHAPFVRRLLDNVEQGLRDPSRSDKTQEKYGLGHRCGMTHH
jgi:hypothetical protein